jgi:glycosyltransferase involved in cell wall biosynthesis
MRPLTLSIIIPTKNRPEDLLECVESILKQDHLPQQLVVIDQSTTAIIERSLIERLKPRSSAIQLIYLHVPELTGLPQARNLGVSSSNGEIVMFLDDDVLLQGGYISAIIDGFLENPEEAGLGGAVRPCANRAHAFLAKVFHHGPFSGEREIITKQHRFLTRIAPVPMTYLSGCNMSFHRQVFNHYKFNEQLTSYGLGEDMLFTYLVSKHNKLSLLPKAQVFHKRSAVNRSHIGHLKETQVLFYFYFYVRYLPRKLTTLLAYIWCNVGLIISTTLKFWDLRRVFGLFRGYSRVLRVVMKLNSLENELKDCYK